MRIMLAPIIIVGIVIIITLISMVVMIVKKTKNNNTINELKDIIIDKVKDSLQDDKHITCEYCGTSNDKENKKCSACGAKLNHTKNSSL